MVAALGKLGISTCLELLVHNNFALLNDKEDQAVLKQQLAAEDDAIFPDSDNTFNVLIILARRHEDADRTGLLTRDMDEESATSLPLLSNDASGVEVPQENDIPADVMNHTPGRSRLAFCFLALFRPLWYLIQ